MRPNLPRLVATALPLLLLACGVDEAPKELKTLVPWFWSHYDAASDEEMASGIVALAGAVSSVTADAPLKAMIGRLTAADVAGLNSAKPDVSKARGMFVVTEFGCTLAQAEKIAIALEQDSLNPDTYDKYQRTYTSSREDYLTRKTDRLTWTTDLTATNLATFTEHLAGGARFVPDQGKQTSPFGAALLTRTWLTRPAETDDKDKSWDQDYQVEVYFERKPGRMVHLFAAWRHIDYSYLDTEDDSMVSTMLGKFVDWDTNMEKNCKAGKPK